jgi:hypothetical protein
MMEDIKAKEGTMKFEKVIPGHWDTDEGTEMANRSLGETRPELMMGELSDLALANAQFLVSRNSLELIHYQTAAKERIRFLSAQLARANMLLEEVHQACLVGDDDGISVTEEPTITTELFGRICDHRKAHRP